MEKVLQPALRMLHGKKKRKVATLNKMATNCHLLVGVHKTQNNSEAVATEIAYSRNEQQTAMIASTDQDEAQA